MNNAENISCPIFYKPDNTEFNESIRMFQGCPTVAVTKNGRIFLGWYSGGITEPHMNNYNLLVYSDDEGKTWSDPLLVIPSSYEYCIHSLDIQLFIDPAGALHVQWVQNNTQKETEIKQKGKPYQPLKYNDGYLFGDFQHHEWETVCENPDSENPEFSEPRFVYDGFMRCKPTFLKNGEWLSFAYDQITDRYGYYKSFDSGKTYKHYYGCKKNPTYFDEAMAYQKDDGSVRMFARNRTGELAESISYDNGETWSDVKLSGIVCSDTRFFVQKLPSGRVMLIVNDDRKVRKNMTVLLSEDDGETWPYKKCFDSRLKTSYPDADYRDGTIYLTYDCGRTSEKEILFASFTEQDIIDGKEIEIKTVSKPPEFADKETVTKAVRENKIIAIVRSISEEKLIPLAKALYDGGIRLLEITYSADQSVGDTETARRIKMLVDEFKDKLYIGAGSVITAEQVRLTKMAGGNFIISPNTDEKVIWESHICGMVSIPGALTPTEIRQAVRFGADFVKLFPSGTFGTEYLKAIKAPLSDVDILVVGGIDDKNMREYIDAGACGVGIGSNIINKEMIRNDDYDGITNLAKRYVEALGDG